MQKLLNKKLLGKKGFTLAELLVVIAILAILIAIAVPVFTHMVAEANLRVNQANVHSVRSAAVAHILTHLGEADDSQADGSGPKLNSNIGKTNAGWVATAKVDNNGNISELKVYVVNDTTNKVEGIFIGESFTRGYIGQNYGSRDDFFAISDSVSSGFATVKPSMGEAVSTDGSACYYIQAIITDLKDD